MIVQLGDHFVGQPRHLTVIQHRRQQRVLVTLLSFDFILLTRNITFVFDLDFDLLGRFGVVQTWRERCHLHQFLIGHFRAA
ncbi:hypothetical protein D3C86_1516130 [compost metagenome]